MTPLRQRMIEDMKLEQKPENTRRAYVQNVAALAKFYGKSPDQLDREQIRDYLVYLVQEKKYAPSTYRQVLSSLRFFYRKTRKHSSSAKRARESRAAKRGRSRRRDSSQSERALLIGDAETRRRGDETEV